MAEYFMLRNGVRLGPLEPNGLVRNGLTRATMVWREGMEGYARADSIPELATVEGGLPPDSPGQGETATPPECSGGPGNAPVPAATKCAGNVSVGVSDARSATTTSEPIQSPRNSPPQQESLPVPFYDLFLPWFISTRLPWLFSRNAVPFHIGLVLVSYLLSLAFLAGAEDQYRAHLLGLQVEFPGGSALLSLSYHSAAKWSVFAPWLMLAGMAMLAILGGSRTSRESAGAVATDDDFSGQLVAKRGLWTWGVVALVVLLAVGHLTGHVRRFDRLASALDDSYESRGQSRSSNAEKQRWTKWALDEIEVLKKKFEGTKDQDIRQEFQSRPSCSCGLRHQRDQSWVKLWAKER